MTLIEEALARVEEFRSSGRLVRHFWSKTREDGLKTVCLLAALSTEVRDAESASACPASLLDPWFAHLTPWFDDCGSEAAWPDMVARYSGIVKKLMSLPVKRRMQLGYASKATILREAMRHTQSAEVLAVCETAIELCEAVAAGQPRDNKAFRSAEEAASSYVVEQAEIEWARVEVGAEEVEGAKVEALVNNAAAWTLGVSATGAADAAGAAAWAAGRATAAKMSRAAQSAATDRITAAIFDLIEAA